MRKNSKPILITIFCVLLFEVLAVILSIYSGVTDVAATHRDGKMIHWLMSTTRDHSIAVRARAIPFPALDDSAMVLKGFDHYNEMCVTCHGAPGRKPDELAEGLNPHAPNLARSTRDMEPSEMFLVVKDGIKMTGMPGFGPTHSDSEIWAIVAFMKRLQTMSATEYAQFQSQKNSLQEPPDDQPENKKTGHRH